MIKAIIIAHLAIGIAVLFATPAYAHGVGERYDLPVPLNYFLVGAAATVAVSFFLIGLFVGRKQQFHRYPRYNLLSSVFLKSTYFNKAMIYVVKLISVALFVITLATAILGNNSPIDNFAPTFVWIIFWVGMGFITVLIGDIWTIVNPWKIIYEWVEQLIGNAKTQPPSSIVRYPIFLDMWPGVLLFFGFVWIENVYSGGAKPLNLGILISVYSIVTWMGIVIFGKYNWLRYGEVFSILFGYFARLSPIEFRVSHSDSCNMCEQNCVPDNDGGCVDCYECFDSADGIHRQLNIRPYFVGLYRSENVSSAATFFVIIVLASVTFDGLTATRLWLDFQNAIYPITEPLGLNTSGVVGTIGLVVLQFIFLSFYIIFSWAMSWFSATQFSTWATARIFVCSLIPIALAYHLSHYQSYLLIQGQFIIPLLSDPFGLGWDLFGTTGFKPNIAIINAKFVWISSVVAIVVGHVISVYTSHLTSLGAMRQRSTALKSQYPMLVLMVFYTATSLWIIAQPIVEP